jgi:acyl carrier protein/NAD(P)-dependent dehydrogenase (short-subunit alcohol dehydrogenase family)
VQNEPAADLAEIVREVVAEKTGYPTDMLDLDMELEAELGVDSIKQVEILAGLRERLPNLPEIAPSRLAELRTLRQIAMALGTHHVSVSSTTNYPAAPVVSSTTAPAPAPVQNEPAADLAGIVREVVAEKTGYPTDMLDLDMELEAELGVDSIKQVEILAGLRERLPNLPEIAPSRLAELRTLRQIAMALGAHSAPVASTTNYPAAPVVSSTMVPAPAPVQNEPAADLAEIVREVVAEKTGYPTDMLDLDMELEAELGVDSIKQVEILAGLRERLPNLPEIAPSRLAELRTLRQIAMALGAHSAPVASTMNGAAAPAASPVATSAPVPNELVAELAEIVREVVAEKTGYPTDMLDLDMELEAELGVDSIKQIEILAGLRERLPNLPEIAPSRLAELRTLRQIAMALGTHNASVSSTTNYPAAPVVSSTTVPAPAPVQSEPAADLAEIVREVVAEKTGYPIDMLDLDMELEAELGVDSIKQVEILASLRERLPNLPEIAPARLAELRTLRQIAMALVAHTPVASTARTATVLEVTADEIAKKNGIFRQVVELEEIPPSGVPMRGFDKRARIAVTPENTRLAEALVGEFSRRGLDAAIGLETRPDASVVISTSGLANDLDPEAVHLAAFRAARALAPLAAESAAVFVTLQDTGGSFGRGLDNLAQAWRGGLTGLVKTARHEWPNAAVKAIDIQRGTTTDHDLARRIVDELLQGGPDVEVGLTAIGRRLIPVTRIASLGEIDAPKLRDGLVCVVSGGGRGVTAEAILGLATVARLRFVLLGRTELVDWPTDLASDTKPAEIRGILAEKAMAEGQKPNPRGIGQLTDRLLASREIRATLSRLEAAGCEAVYRPVDVGNAAAVKLILDEIRGKWGRISGLVHGAGVLADKLIKDKTEAQVSQVFRAKAGGLAVLLEALNGEPLEFVNLFSSIAGRYGNPGQADYAMANEVLNRVAWVLAATHPACRVSAINWGPWDGGMVDEAIRAQFSQRGVPIVPVAIGVEGFVREIAAGGAQSETVFAGLFDAIGGLDPAVAYVAKLNELVKPTSPFGAN